MRILSENGSGEDQLLNNYWKSPEPCLDLKASISLQLEIEIHSFPVFSLAGEHQYLWYDQIQQDIRCSPRSLGCRHSNNFYFQDLSSASLKRINDLSWNSAVIWVICFSGTLKLIHFASLLRFGFILFAAEKHLVSGELSVRIWRQFALRLLLCYILRWIYNLSGRPD